MARQTKPPSSPRSRWALRVGDLPPDSALRRDLLLLGVGDNPAFRVAVWRRRRQGWPDVLAVAAFLAFLHGTLFLALLNYPPFAKAAWGFGFWSLCMSAVYMMLLFHGGWAFEHGTKSPFHRPLLMPFIEDLRTSGHKPLEIAVGIWGAMASRGRRRLLDFWAMAILLTGWGVAVAAPWRLNEGMLMLAISTAGYHLAAGRSGPRAMLTQAAGLVKARREQIDPGKKRVFGKPPAAPPPTSYLRFAIPAYVFAALIIEIFAAAGIWILNDRLNPDPALYCSIATALGVGIGFARGALSRDDAADMLADMAKMIAEIQAWQQPEAWKGEEEKRIPWRNLPRPTGAGEESRPYQPPPPGRALRPSDIRPLGRKTKR